MHHKRCSNCQRLIDTSDVILFHSSPCGQSGGNFTDDISNTFSSMKDFVFLFEFHLSLFLRVNLQWASIGGLGNGLASNRRQVITWTNTNPVNSSPPGAAYMRQWTGSSLVQVMAWGSVRRQAITWINAGLLSIGLLGTNFSEIWIWILSYSFTKIDLKMSSTRMAAILSRGCWVNWHRYAAPEGDGLTLSCGVYSG